MLGQFGLKNRLFFQEDRAPGIFLRVLGVK
jgi:hypothetical protein